MGDISTWNPVDNSNTTAPPDGWPEGMAPSAVNNSARAMMGAVRRWYDTVTAQLATFLPLSGGTITGNLTVNGRLSAPELWIDGLLTVDRAPGTFDTIISDAAGGAALNLQANDSFYDNDVHHFRNSAGTATFTVDSAGNGTVPGTIQGATLTSTGNINATYDIGCRDLISQRNVQASLGTVTAAQLTSTGNITAAGTVTGTSFIGNVSVPASGPVTTGGTVTGGQVTSTGNINASGNITGANLLAGSSVYVAGQPALSVTTAGRLDILTPSGDLALILYGSPTWQNSYFNNTHQFGNSGRDFTYATISVAGCFNVTGTWGTFSDASLKDDVAPYERGLEAILGLSPISFRYQAHTPFADPERTLRYGLMAQDVAGIIPEMVGETTLETGDTVGTVFPGHLVYLLVNAAKELAAQNAALTARIEALEGNHV